MLLCCQIMERHSLHDSLISWCLWSFDWTSLSTDLTPRPMACSANTTRSWDLCSSRMGNDPFTWQCSMEMIAEIIGLAIPSLSDLLVNSMVVPCFWVSKVTAASLMSETMGSCWAYLEEGQFDLLSEVTTMEGLFWPSDCLFSICWVSFLEGCYSPANRSSLALSLL